MDLIILATENIHQYDHKNYFDSSDCFNDLLTILVKILQFLIPKLAIVVLCVHYEPLNSNFLTNASALWNFYYSPINALGTMAFGKGIKEKNLIFSFVDSKNYESSLFCSQ